MFHSSNSLLCEWSNFYCTCIKRCPTPSYISIKLSCIKGKPEITWSPRLTGSYSPTGYWPLGLDRKNWAMKELYQVTVWKVDRETFLSSLVVTRRLNDGLWISVPIAVLKATKTGSFWREAHNGCILLPVSNTVCPCILATGEHGLGKVLLHPYPACGLSTAAKLVTVWTKYWLVRFFPLWSRQALMFFRSSLHLYIV